MHFSGPVDITVGLLVEAYGERKIETFIIYNVHVKVSQKLEECCCIQHIYPFDYLDPKLGMRQKTQWDMQQEHRHWHQ